MSVDTGPDIAESDPETNGNDAGTGTDFQRNAQGNASDAGDAKIPHTTRFTPEQYEHIQAQSNPSAYVRRRVDDDRHYSGSGGVDPAAVTDALDLLGGDGDEADDAPPPDPLPDVAGDGGFHGAQFPADLSAALREQPNKSAFLREAVREKLLADAATASMDGDGDGDAGDGDGAAAARDRVRMDEARDRLADALDDVRPADAADARPVDPGRMKHLRTLHKNYMREADKRSRRGSTDPPTVRDVFSEGEKRVRLWADAAGVSPAELIDHLAAFDDYLGGERCESDAEAEAATRAALDATRGG